MKNTFKNLAVAGLAVCLANGASALDYHWTGLANDGLWASAGNWDNGAPTTTTTSDGIFLDAANGWSVMTIATNETVVGPNMLFGPEWGATLNIRGTLHYYWYMVPVGNTSVINMYGGSSLTGEGIGLGDSWWWHGGSGPTLNLYGNATVGINWMFWGGYINLQDTAVLSITNGLTVETVDSVTDATRAINLQGHGTLVLPTGFTATVQDWISRGIVKVYGIPNDAAEIIIDEANTNWPGRTVVTTTSTGPNPIVAVRIEVPRTNLSIGGLEQAQVYADYTVTTNVNVTTTATNLTYTSSNTNVVTVATNGMVRATGLGTAAVKAVIGTFTNSVSVTVAAYTNHARLVHRYSFAEAAGTTTAADSMPGNSPDWDGTLLNGGAALNGTGQLVLDGYDGYVQFPAGILTNMDAVTIETWVTFGTISNWSVLFTFGDSTGTSGFDYISCQPHTGFATAQTGIRNATTEQNPWFTPVLDNYTNLHLVAVFHPEAGYCAIYTNGMLAAVNSSVSITMAEAFASGDPLNYIGRSQWSADPYLPVIMDEFRIYKGPLTDGQIRADAALGANQVIGTSTNVSLTASAAGSNLVLKWPTTSALVTLLASPVLGSGAVWTPVAIVPTVAGGNYQVTLPKSSAAQFFRLQ